MKVMSEERTDYVAETLGDEIEDSPTVEFRDPIKELGFAKVDHIITLDTSLSDGAYRTYALLHYYWQRKRAAWAGTDTLAAIRDVKESTIRKHLKELQDAGLISRQRRMGKSSMTYLEDLPERYAEAAKAILTKRQKNSGKSAINIAVSPPKNERLDDDELREKTSTQTDENGRGKRTIEGEPLKESGDAKIASPSPEEKEAEELYNAMPSQSAGMVRQEHTAATADPRIEKRQFVRQIAPICAEIMGRGVPISEDTRTAKKIFDKRLPLARVLERLDAYRNGEGEEFRKPNAIADWIVGRLERDIVPRVLVENNDAAIKARLMAA